MKSIIIKSLFLFLLFIATGCNFSQRNNRESEAQQSTDLLLESEEDVVISTASYAGEYSFNSEEEDASGNVSINHSAGNTISFEFHINRGYNSGEVSGEVEITDGKGVFRNDEYGECILEFVFTDNSVKISHGEGGYQCGFGMNVWVDNTFVRKSNDVPVFAESIINEDLLWDIFLKIHEDSIPDYLFNTIQKRRQAKIDELFTTGYEDIEKNRLRYDVTDSNGSRIFMGLACYLTDDGKKLITLFYHGAGMDVYENLSNQTYEYDMATAELKAIERPIDPYTIDEFIDEATLTPEQISEMKKLFSYKNLLINVDINRTGFSVYFSAIDAFDYDWEKFGDFIRNNQVRRDWNGKRFVKAEKK